MALEMFAIAFGKFFIRSSGDVNAIMFGPKGLCGLSLPAIKSAWSVKVTYTYGLPSWDASILDIT
jgi:hypothetical protein